MKPARIASTTLALAGAIVSLVLVCGKGREPMGVASANPGPAADMALDGTDIMAAGGGAKPAGEECSTAPDFYACMSQRAQATDDLLDALGELEGSKSPNAKAAGLAALKVNSPVVQEAALRVLGPFGGDDAVAQAALPKLLGDVPVVQQAAAATLQVNRRFSPMAYLYASNHPSRVDFRARSTNVTRWGFAAPPSAQSFPPGDGDRSVALRVKRPVAEIATFYGKGAAQSFTATQWQKYVSDKMKASMPTSAEVSAHVKEIDALSKEYARTKDPAVQERIRAVSDAYRKKTEALPKFDSSFYDVRTSATGAARAQARFVVLERQGAVDTKLAVIYDESALKETVVQISWASSVKLPSGLAKY